MVSPRNMVCSRLIEVISERILSEIMFVASFFPPMPASSKTTSQFLSAKKQNARAVSSSKVVG